MQQRMETAQMSKQVEQLESELHQNLKSHQTSQQRLEPNLILPPDAQSEGSPNKVKTTSPSDSKQLSPKSPLPPVPKVKTTFRKKIPTRENSVSDISAKKSRLPSVAPSPLGVGLGVDQTQILDMIYGALVSYAKKSELQDLSELREGFKNNQAMMTVLQYKMGLLEQQIVNSRLEKSIEEVAQEAFNLQQEIVQAVNTDKGLSSREIAKILKSLNQQMSMMSKRIAQHERERLQGNYNKVPKDIRYLTQSEAELKKELIQTIETGQEYLTA